MLKVPIVVGENVNYFDAALKLKSAERIELPSTNATYLTGN